MIFTPLDGHSFKIFENKDQSFKEKYKLAFFCCFQGERGKSRSVAETGRNVKFDKNHEISFPVVAGDLKTAVPLEILNKIDFPLQVALVRINMQNQKRQVLSTKEIEWRYCLTQKKPVLFKDVRFGEYGNEEKALGYLRFELQLTNIFIPIPQKSFTDQIKK